MSNSQSTLDKIQSEIQETLKREDELRSGYSKSYNGNSPTGSNPGEPDEIFAVSTTNGVNGGSEKSNGVPPKPNKSNGFKKFTPNITTRGVMQKFFKSRGKINTSAMKPKEPLNDWQNDATFEPAKLTIERGKPLRNGYVPAEVKIVRELNDFQQREAELRRQRRQSQPDLMAALDLEDDSDNEWENDFKEHKILKQAKSMANLYQPEDEDIPQNNSAPCSLKPALSLATLCDLSDDEIEMPGTHSLIMQFENMKLKEGCA